MSKSQYAGFALALLLNVVFGTRAVAGQQPKPVGNNYPPVYLPRVLASERVAAPAGELILTVSLSIDRASVTPGEPVMLRFAIWNRGTGTAYVLKWGTPLEGFKRDMFAVTRAGVRAPYTGMLVKRGAPAAADYAAIAPGSVLSVTLDLEDGYRIEQAGDYELAFVTNLPDVRTDPAATGARRTPLALAPATTRFVVNGDRARPPMRINTVNAFTQCTAQNQSTIGSAFAAAQTYANESLSVLQNANAPASAPRYTKWFGVHTAGRYATVTNHFSAIANLISTRGVSGMGWDCSLVGCGTNDFAYVFSGDSTYTIHLCNQFWLSGTTGQDSQAGTIIHEISHFDSIAGTDDFAYGQTAAAALAVSNPAQAVANADSHEYFAENTPALSMGSINTATPTASPTQPPAPTSSPTHTSTPSSTPSPTTTSGAPLTPTLVPTSTVTPSPTPMLTPSATSAVILTETPGATATSSPVPGGTATLAPTDAAGTRKLFLPVIMTGTN